MFKLHKSVWVTAIVVAFLALTTLPTAANETVGPSNPDDPDPYSSEVVEESEGFVPDADGIPTWIRTRQTTGGTDSSCHWEWTKTWQWEEDSIPLTTWYGSGGQVPIARRSMSIWAYGALLGGSAWAWEYIKPGSTEAIGAVGGSGTVEVRLISAPNCQVCTRTITASARPRFTAEIDKFNSSAFGAAAGHVQIHGTQLSQLNSEIQDGVVSTGTAGNEVTFGLPFLQFTLTSRTDGNDVKVCQKSSADSKNIDWEIVHFSASPYLKAWADGYWVYLFADEGEVESKLYSSRMNTRIRAECSGCCQGWVNIWLGSTGLN